MESAGCEAWFPASRLALRGYAEVVAHLPGLVRIRRELFRRLLAARVSLFIGVDAPDFNLGLESRLKRAGVRTIHYVSPSVWAWRSERIDAIARSADRLLALFPFEPPLYAKAGLPVTFVGHPLAANAAGPNARRETRELLQLDAKQPVFALLPGSRMSELEMHTELLLRTAAGIVEALPEVQFLVPLASRETRAYFETAQHRMELQALPLKLLYGHADDALQGGRCRDRCLGHRDARGRAVALPAYHLLPRQRADRMGGPPALPAAVRGTAQRARGRFVVPEFLQVDATADNLVRASLNLYDDTETRRRLEALFAGMASSLKADTAALAAEAVALELRAAGVAC